MDAVVESFVSPNTRKDRISPILVNPSVDKYAVNAALKFMACGSIITYHWQLNPFHHHLWLFTRLFVVVWFPTSGRFATRVLLGSCGKSVVSPSHCYDSGACILLEMLSQPVAPEDWIKTLAACSCGLSTTCCRKVRLPSASPFYTSWLKVIICGQFG
jgi:hypothetical protein